jgi:hypothetical protein
MRKVSGINPAWDRPCQQMATRSPLPCRPGHAPAGRRAAIADACRALPSPLEGNPDSRSAQAIIAAADGDHRCQRPQEGRLPSAPLAD